MLRLERKSYDPLVHVLFRDKESLFTRSFATAFILALAIHLGLFILFRISCLKILSGVSTLPPIHVEADIALKEAAAVADIESNVLSIQGIPIPFPSHPELSNHPTFLAVRPTEYIKEPDISENSFIGIEKSVYSPDPTPPIGRPKAPIELVVSGPLASQAIVFDGLNRLAPAIQGALRAVYNVLVDGRSGRVVWFEPKQTTNMPSIDRLAESILRGLLFASDAATVATAGEIELHFNPEPL